MYKAAYPFQDDVLALPVVDIDQAATWYGERFGLEEVERNDDPVPNVVLERDGVRIGFAINGGDATQDGAAILVTDVARARDELEANGVATGNWRVDERDGEKYQVFFVVAPDGLCYYFHELIGDE
ncbi:MAG: VOC family protein [Pseudomonadales bacterium]|nr:VOC family protein [Pseudomonadales bacterium]